MAREIIGGLWDRNNRNNVNGNFEELYNYMRFIEEAKNKIDEFLLFEGIITRDMIQNGSVSSSKIEDGAITSSKIEDSAVTSSKIEDNAVDHVKLSVDSVMMNRGKEFPLKLLSGGTSALFKNAYLDIKVFNAMIGKYYRIYSVNKNANISADYSNVTGIEIQVRGENESVWENLIQISNMDLLGNNQTGIKTHLIRSRSVREQISITLDWDRFTEGITYNGSREYIIDPTQYIYARELTETEGYHDSDKFKRGYFVASATGVERESESWTSTDFIKVNPNKLYLKNRSGQLAFFDENLNYISGHTNSDSNMMFTTPPNANFIKTSIRSGEEVGFKITVINSDKVHSVKGIFRELYNPFKFSYVKVIGDSNAAGVGGTGYTRTDDTNELIPGTSSIYANENGYCWANLLGSHLIDKFNKEQIVAFNHEDIRTVEGLSHTVYESDNVSQYNTTLYDGAKIEFYIYGEEFTIITNPAQENARLRVFFDDVQSFIFAPDSVNRNKEVVRSTGKDGYTKVSLQADRGNVELVGLKLQKHIKFKNFGITGRSSRTTLQQIDNLVDGSESIVLCLVGSNDRGSTEEFKYEAELVNNLRNISMEILNKGAKPVLISSSPASVSNEVDVPNRNYHKEDVDTATMMAAATFGYEHISVYNHILDYCLYTGTDIDYLLADGVHPNDAGYDVAFNYILKKIGLGRKRPGATW